jgi:hypothetical protein
MAMRRFPWTTAKFAKAVPHLGHSPLFHPSSCRCSGDRSSGRIPNPEPRTMRVLTGFG